MFRVVSQLGGARGTGFPIIGLESWTHFSSMDISGTWLVSATQSPSGLGL